MYKAHITFYIAFNKNHSWTVMSWAYVLLNTEPGQMENVLEKMKQINGVEEAHMVYGNYDILIKVKSSSPKELKIIIKT